MKGVILAAGIGSRLQPMTDNKPKCLIKVAGKTMLDYQLDAYRGANIKDIIIVVGYKGDMIERHCRYIEDLNITIVRNEEYEETNNMYSLYLAIPYVDDCSFILNNADLVIESSVIKNMLNATAENIVAVDMGLFNEESMKVVCDNNGYIQDISKAITKDKSTGCSIDFYKISKNGAEVLFSQITEIIHGGNRKDWTEVALQKIFKSNSVAFEALNVSGIKWVEIDNINDLVLADSYFSQLTKKITDYQCYLFDLDGTVYIGESPILPVVDSIFWLKSQNKSIKFISNNSSKAKSDYVAHLKNMGIECALEDVILSTDATVDFLKEKNITKIYVLGTQNLKNTFLENGFLIDENNVEMVVVGYDTELNYDKLKKTCYLINQGIDYVATHRDISCPTEHGPIPDIGALISMLQLTTKVEPLKIFGKPSAIILESLVKSTGFDKADILMIGDRLETDILMAKNSGIDSVLVLSGDTQRQALGDSDIEPTYVLKEFNLL